ncbi:MAG: hypothetical protein RR562_03875 [Longicatena sp.]
MKSIRIPFDRVKLTLSCILYLLLFLMMPALCLYVSLDPLMIFFLLTICWFMIKGAIRNVKRLFKNKPICSIDDKEIQINSLSNKTYTMKWNDLEKVTMKEKHHSVQFLLFGSHVEHASGVYMIHIDYPFLGKDLESKKQALLECFAKHKVPVETIQKDRKGVRVHV